MLAVLIPNILATFWAFRVTLKFVSLLTSPSCSSVIPGFSSGCHSGQRQRRCFVDCRSLGSNGYCIVSTSPVVNDHVTAAEDGPVHLYELKYQFRR